jgi:hypothetical protein
MRTDVRINTVRPHTHELPASNIQRLRHWCCHLGDCSAHHQDSISGDDRQWELGGGSILLSALLGFVLAEHAGWAFVSQRSAHVGSALRAFHRIFRLALRLAFGLYCCHESRSRFQTQT